MTTATLLSGPELRKDWEMNRRTTRLLLLGAALLTLTVWSGGCGSKESEPEKKADTTDKAATPGEEGAPKIASAAPDFNFGKVKQGASVEHVFKIKNEGTADLKIEKARGS